MAENPNPHDMLKAIRARAHTPPSDPSTSWDQRLDDAEILASLADGSRQLADLDDATLQRCLDSAGTRAVVDAALQGASSAAAPAQAAPAALPETSTARTAETTPESASPSPSSRASTPRWLMAFKAWWNQPLFPSGQGLSVGWAAAAAVVVALFGALALFRPEGSGLSPEGPDFAQSNASNAIAFPFPPNSPQVQVASFQSASWPPDLTEFPAPADQRWIGSSLQLAQGLPHFAPDTVTLGAADTEATVLAWKLATVIIPTRAGFGSGVIVSSDGWILTAYSVVAEAAQQAARTGAIAQLEIIAPRRLDDHLEPRSDRWPATLFRADPTTDLALLKLDPLPSSPSPLPHLRLGPAPEPGADIFLLGSNADGPAWWLRSGTVLVQPETNPIRRTPAGFQPALPRPRLEILESDARTVAGDLGGPLLDADGQVVGITFGTPNAADPTAPSQHIATRHLQAILQNLPTTPEPVPFDPWTAGLPLASLLRPESFSLPADTNRVPVLLYRHALGLADESLTNVALSFYLDLSAPPAPPSPPSRPAALVPTGLWGLENQGSFRFDFFLTLRSDDLLVSGITGPDGIVREIRLGSARTGRASLTWHRPPGGLWTASIPDPQTLIMDPATLNPDQARRLALILPRLFSAPSPSANPAPPG